MESMREAIELPVWSTEMVDSIGLLPPVLKTDAIPLPVVELRQDPTFFKESTFDFPTGLSEGGCKVAG